MAGAAVAVTDELSQNLRDQFLQCKVCLDSLKDPKTLPCLHTFCLDCVQRYIAQNSLRSDGCSMVFACPICRRHIFVPKNGASGFPDSFFIRSLDDALVESSLKTTSKMQCDICKFKSSEPVDAKTMCIECRVELCESCANEHQVSALTDSHTLLQLFSTESSTVINRQNYCRVHRGETVKYYCESCNSPVCLACTFLDHRGHTISEIRRVRQKFVSDIESLVDESEDTLVQLQSARDDLAELENELFIRKEAVKSQIRRTMHELVKSINERETQLIGEVEAFYNIVPVSVDRHKVERTIYRLQRAHDFARQLMAVDTSPITQLVNRSEAKDNLRQAQAYELPDLTVHLSKLDANVCYLSAASGVNCVDVGVLFKYSESPDNKSCLVPTAKTSPVNKALFMGKLRVRSCENTAFGEIVALAFLPNNDCAVLAATSKFVRIFDTRTGLLRCEFGDDDGVMMTQPSDMALTRDSDLAIVDCGLLAVKVFNSQGTLQMTFGNDEIFALPIAIAIDSIGRFLVCDQVKRRITVHRQHGELLQTIDIIQLSTPQDICSFYDRIYVTDCVNNELAIYTYNKDGLQYVGKLSAGISSPDFLDCSGICIDRAGNLLVSDSIQNRIHVFNAASGCLSGVTAAGRMFHRPKCMAVSADGLLAVYQQQGVSDIELVEDSIADDEITSSEPSLPDPANNIKHEVSIYRLLKADL